MNKNLLLPASLALTALVLLAGCESDRTRPPGAVLVPGEVRHHLFLAVKESLNNAIRHSGATEIVFHVGVSENRLQISINDNGAGFETGERLAGNGLTNLRSRLQNLAGHCEIISSPGAGTTVVLQILLPNRANV